MAAPDADAPSAASAQHQAALTAPPSPQDPPGFAMPPRQSAPPSPQGPPGFGSAHQQGAPAAPQGAPVMAPLPQQQHYAPAMSSGSLQGTEMLSQAAHPVDMMASMPLPFASQQALQCMVSPPSLPTGLPAAMAMQQLQTGAPPPLPLGPPPAMQQQQQQQAQQVEQNQMMMTQQNQMTMTQHNQMMMTQQNQMMMTQPPLPFGPPPVMQQQQLSQGSSVMMAQPPLPFVPAPVMLQQPTQADPVMIAQPHLSAPPLKRQRLDQYDMPYGQGQNMTDHQQDLVRFNGTMGPSYGSYLHNEVQLPSFGATEPSLPSDASNTVFVEGLPSNCTKREVAHIFRQYMGFREVRLVNKGSSRHVLCFVEFATPAQAFLAMRTLQVVISLTNKTITHPICTFSSPTIPA
ncbi:hypothetical protein ACP70R_007188 [Stipagrostis hirtigluma subsp. patula]